MNTFLTILILIFLLFWIWLVLKQWQYIPNPGNWILILTPSTLFVLIFCYQFLDIKLKAQQFEISQLQDIKTDQRLLKTTTEHILRMIDVLDRKPPIYPDDQGKVPPSKEIPEIKKDLQKALENNETK